jgi:crossover junction endodeoxyribonuclease RuvC
MSVILGIDPGSLITGYGIIRVDGDKLYYLDSGCIRTKGKKIPPRLQQIFQSIIELTDKFSPDEAAIEEVFMHTNPGSALKLGQARGAAITALVQSDIVIGEYSAREIKKAVVGTGAANKSQVSHMVQTLLGLNKAPQADAADALAVAICHINTEKSLAKINQANHFSHGRLAHD